MRVALRNPQLAALVACAALCACTRTIDSGSYGPFRIGESKSEALQKALSLNATIEPLPYPDIRVDAPTRSDLEQLSGQAGVLVWIDREPLPLRIELSNGVVVKTWPDFTSTTFARQSAPAYSHLAALQAAVPAGTPESALLDAIASVADDRVVSAGVFVVGYQPYRTGEKSDKAGFESLLMASQAWRFDGLEEQLHFDPFYSRVTLYFRSEHLERIEHWWNLFELP
jgi:hypothetical protein